MRCKRLYGHIGTHKAAGSAVLGNQHTAGGIHLRNEPHQGILTGRKVRVIKPPFWPLGTLFHRAGNFGEVDKCRRTVKLLLEAKAVLGFALFSLDWCLFHPLSEEGIM